MITLALHGGAGTIPKGTLTPQQEEAYIIALRAALHAGWAILEGGGTATEAVATTVSSLEDCPLFNAGKGAVFTHEETHEMDAAIVSGTDRSTGAVCGVEGVRNPIRLAQKVMENSEHILLSGRGAEAFAKTQGVDFESPEYFYNELRHQQWEEAVKADRVQLDHSNAAGDKKFGTVGAVALDKDGNLAAATSTGGLTNKRWGRIGDTPIIGAGTWADNATCAVSCTGVGEFFLRTVVGHEIDALMRYGGKKLEEACTDVVHGQLVKIGGEGGVIALDAGGNVSLSFNSDGMYRAFKRHTGEEDVAIYR
jgi:beta-aspartyl-peptidase (threonine type)